MGIRQPAILEVLANQPAREFDSMYDTALLMKESVVESFKYMLIVLICSDIICPNKEVKQRKIDQLVIDG